MSFYYKFIVYCTHELGNRCKCLLFANFNGQNLGRKNSLRCTEMTTAKLHESMSVNISTTWTHFPICIVLYQVPQFQTQHALPFSMTYLLFYLSIYLFSSAVVILVAPQKSSSHHISLGKSPSVNIKKSPHFIYSYFLALSFANLNQHMKKQKAKWIGNFMLHLTSVHVKQSPTVFTMHYKRIQDTNLKEPTLFWHER